MQSVNRALLLNNISLTLLFGFAYASGAIDIAPLASICALI